jgi:agmatine deiminase
MNIQTILSVLLITGSLSVFSQNSCPPETGIPHPPTMAVRTPAEWEALEAIMVSWRIGGYPGTAQVLTEIVRAAQPECRVVICYEGQAMLDSAKNSMIANGIDITQNITFLPAESNSVWIRDYGPTTVYENEVGNRRLVDWIYNRYPPFSPFARLKDDSLSLDIARHLNLPLHSTTGDTFGLVNTGGNFMTDGMGRAFASRLILDDNALPAVFCTEKSEPEIDETFEQYMGIHEYVKFKRLPFDSIDHIDMHYKLLDESTLLVAEYPENISNGPQLNANITQFFSHWKTPFGTPYHLIRIPIPPDRLGAYPLSPADSFRTYVNAVFVNKTIIVPTYNCPTDSIALAIWQKAMPGYTIKGVFSGPLIRRYGAVHCVTKEIAAADPLLIQLQRPPACVYASGPYQISAHLNHSSGIQSANLFFKSTDQSEWQNLPLLNDSLAGNWVAFLPAFPEGTTVHYYIEAIAQNGKVQRRPMPAPEAYFETTFCAPATTENVAQALKVESLFPNPAESYSLLNLQVLRSMKAEIRVVSMSGQLEECVFSGMLHNGLQQIKLDAQHLDPGIYIISIRTEIGVQSLKWVVAP